MAFVGAICKHGKDGDKKIVICMVKKSLARVGVHMAVFVRLCRRPWTHCDVMIYHIITKQAKVSHINLTVANSYQNRICIQTVVTTY